MAVVYLLKNDCVEYYETLGVFSTKLKAQEALAKCEYQTFKHIEEMELDFLNPIHTKCLGIKHEDRMVLNSGTAYANMNLELRGLNTWTNAEGELVAPRKLGETR